MRLDIPAGPCACGKTHVCSVREIRIEPGALAELPGLMDRNGFLRPCVICDANTRKAAGDAVQALLPASHVVCLDPENLHADEHGVAMVRAVLPEQPDVLLAVGAGTIHDLTRFMAHERSLPHCELPFVSVPTAASVDGFVSTVAAMTWHGCKVTLPAVAPVAVVADSTVFAAAPGRLTASGVGDLLGKYVALADWRIAALVSGEYLCEAVCAMEDEALLRVLDHLGDIAAGSLAGCEELMAGLLLSGLAMQMVGNSRPASGAEHHLSHLWEMEVINGRLNAYHGEKVGVGTLLCARTYAVFAEALRHDRLQPQAYCGLDTASLRQYFSVRPDMLEQILAENTPDPLAGVDPQQFLDHREAILAILDAIPPATALEKALRTVRGKASLAEIGLPDSAEELSLHLSPFVRQRLTLMRLRKLFRMH